MRRHLATVPRPAVYVALAAVAATPLLAPGASPGVPGARGAGPAARAPAASAPSDAGQPPAAAASETQAPRLRETGSAAFAAVRDVVAELEARPETDWSKVDLERLRQHLVGMHRFTLQAEVVERSAVEGGLRTTVRGTTPAADSAIRGAVAAHGPFLAEETGWEVSVEDTSAGVVLEVTAGDEADARKIRGLGYIGLMASGSHHREHHWAIATGDMPHGPGNEDHGGHDHAGHGHDGQGGARR